jgi:hypothetical protein
MGHREVPAGHERQLTSAELIRAVSSEPTRADGTRFSTAFRALREPRQGTVVFIGNDTRLWCATTTALLRGDACAYIVTTVVRGFRDTGPRAQRNVRQSQPGMMWYAPRFRRRHGGVPRVRAEASGRQHPLPGGAGPLRDGPPLRRVLAGGGRAAALHRRGVSRVPVVWLARWRLRTVPVRWLWPRSIPCSASPDRRAVREEARSGGREAAKRNTRASTIECCWPGTVGGLRVVMGAVSLAGAAGVRSPWSLTGAGNAPIIGAVHRRAGS